MNISEAINFSIFSWIRKKEFFNKALPFWISFLVFYALLVAFVLYFFADLFSALASNTLDKYLLTLFKPAYLSEFLGKMFLAIFLILAIVILFCIVVDYFYFKLMQYALSQKGIKSQQISINLFIRLFILQILIVFALLFYPQDKKLLAIQWLSLILFLFAVLFASLTPFVAIFGLCILPYALLIIHNAIRYSQTLTCMLVDNSSYPESLKNSWNLTSNRFWDILFTQFVVLIVLALLLAGISFVLSAIVSTILLLAVPNEIIRYIISDTFSNIIFAPVGYFVQAFLLVFIYSNLISGNCGPCCEKSEKEPCKEIVKTEEPKEKKAAHKIEAKKINPTKNPKSKNKK